MPESGSLPPGGEAPRRSDAEFTRQIQALVENVPDGLCLLDEEQRLLICNDAGLRLLRLLSPQATPGHAVETLAGATLEQFFDGARHEIAVEGPPFCQIVVTAHPVLPAQGDDADAGIRGWVLVLRDVTERQRLAELSRQQERLAAIGQLAAGIAHDFNNILASVLLHAQLLTAEPQLSAAADRRLQVIQQQTKRASELVRQILDFSRRSVMQRSEVDLVALCRDLVEGWRRTLPANVEIAFQHSADRYVVFGDASRLQQALLNLALNAQEAMPRGGRLALMLTHRHIRPNDTVPQLGMEPGLWLQLTMADTGAGIASEALPHVFEPFFSTKPLHEGAGLGLAQVHGIVHQHGGHVKLDSQPQKGTVVTIYLPLQQEPMPTPSRAVSGPHRPTILIVEENADFRDALYDALSGLGYRLALAASGQEALSTARQEGLRPDLVIGDLAMPHMSGMALLQSLRAENPHCRMIIISSYPMPSDSAHLRKAGIVDWLPKPFSVADLIRRIQQVLQG